MTRTGTTTQSKASTPAEALDLLRQALDSGDFEAAAAVFEPEATFVPPDGEPVIGADAIRTSLASLFERRPSFTNRVDELLLGRGTYEIFAAHWPYDEGPIADQLMYQSMPASRSDTGTPAKRVVIALISAEGVGFEPTKDPKALNGFRDRPVQPLRHPSGAGQG